MNKVMLVGRLTKDIEIRYTEGQNPMAVGRTSIAVPRRKKVEGQQDTDFISLKAFGNTALFIQKYFGKGRRIGIVGRLSTGSYVNSVGQIIYYVEVIVDEAEFVDNAPQNQKTENNASADDYVNVPGDIEEELPFN